MRPFTFPDQINPFTFPDQINEVSARLVAAGVVLMCAATLAFRQPWLLVPLAYGFFARVLSGPRFSPLAQLVTRVVTPMIPVAAKLVPGPPKRFAQAVGLVMASTAAGAGPGLRFHDGRLRDHRPDRGGRRPRVGFRLLRRVHLVRGTDAPGHRARRRLCGLQQSLAGPPAGSAKEPRVPVL